MRRATIVATMVIAFSSDSLAASDAEIAKSGEKMSAAFKCLTYARMFHDYKEEDRLFLIGLKAGRDFVEGMKSFSDGLNEIVAFIGKTSNRLCGRCDVRQRDDKSIRSNCKIRRWTTARALVEAGRGQDPS